MNPNKNTEEGKFVVDNTKPWTSSYNHQRRPEQQSRLKAVLPVDKLVQRRGRQFTTDTSRGTRLAELEYQEELKSQLGKPNKEDAIVLVETSNPKKKYLPVNYSNK